MPHIAVVVAVVIVVATAAVAIDQECEFYEFLKLWKITFF